MTPTFDLTTYVDGVRSGDRTLLGRALTLVESQKPSHQGDAQALLTALLPHTGSSLRLGVSGVPGVGKSTLIEALGKSLVETGKRVAVLAVDPSSAKSGGSLLGDKTRMETLAVHPHAFIRPSPTSGVLGGVTRKTREAVLLCEAAGYDVVIVETVGIGQNETTATDIVDLTLLLVLPGAGDELQGIKRGILEQVHIVAVNKADGDNVARAKRAMGDLKSALRILYASEPELKPDVMMCSARNNDGIQPLWQAIVHKWDGWQSSGYLEKLRQEQQIAWLWQLVEQRWMAVLTEDPSIKNLAKDVEAHVRTLTMSPLDGADRLLQALTSVDKPLP